MGLSNRLKKIEKATQSKRIDIESLKLFDSCMMAVDGDVVVMPTAESEGLARLANGTEKAIIYEPDWQNLFVCCDDSGQNTDDKLRIRNANVNIFVFEGVDISKFPKQVVNNEPCRAFKKDRIEDEA